MALRRFGQFVHKHTWVAFKQGCKDMVRDYRDVFVQMGKDSLQYPVSTFFKVGTLGALGYCSWTAPDERQYLGQLLEASHNIIECGSAHSKKAHTFVHSRLDLAGQDRLGYLYAGPVAFMYELHNAEFSALYSNTHMTRRESIVWFKDHILDIGIVGHWRRLEAAMIEYDVEDD